MGRKRIRNCKPAKSPQEKFDLAEYGSNAQIKLIMTLLYQTGVVIIKNNPVDQNLIEQEKNNFRFGLHTDVFERFVNDSTSISVLHDRKMKISETNERSFENCGAGS